MPVQTLNPDTLPKPRGYAQVSIAEGSRTVFIAGQVARTSDGTPVGAEDLAAQSEQAYANVHAAITAAGGTFEDIARLTVYVVDWEPAKMEQFGKGVSRAAKRLGLHVVRPITLIGVAALAEPDLLIEIEAVAVLP